MKFRGLILSVVLCLFLGISFAGMKEGADADNIAITAILMSQLGDERVGSDEPGEVYVNVMGEYHRLALSPYNLSEVLRYQGSREIIFYDVPPSTPDEQPQIAGSVVIPDGVSEAILLFVTSENGGSRYRVFALDNSPDRVPINSLRLINMTRQQLAYDISGRFEKLNPGESTIYPYDRGSDYVKIKLASLNEGGTWRLGMSRYQQLLPGRRTTYLLIPQAQGKESGFAVKVLTDSEAR